MWDKKGNERLAAWRQFRQNQVSQPTDTQINNTVRLWKDCHLGNHHYDFLNIKDWPTPWELILEDDYDEFSRALGMAYTLILIDDWKPMEFYLRSYKDSEHSCFYHVLEFDDIVMNYHYDRTIKNNVFPQSAKLICEYNYIDLLSKSK